MLSNQERRSASGTYLSLSQSYVYTVRRGRSAPRLAETVVT
jgi:hypothetical protein